MIDVSGYLALTAEERRNRVARQQQAYRAAWIAVEGLTGSRHEPTAPESRVMPARTKEQQAFWKALVADGDAIREEYTRLVERQERESFIGPRGPGRTAPVKCICETDDNCLLLYRSVEFGFDLSDSVMEWLPAAVARTERKCKAALHYQAVMLDEILAQDVTCQNEEPWEFGKWFSDTEDDQQLYAHRTEEGGRWIEAPEGQDGLAIDRDAEDYTSRIRSHEMGKLADLKAAMVQLGLSWEEQLPWVERAVGFKRADALRDHAQAAAKAERTGRHTDYVAAPAIVSESQIRLRAYSYCLDYLLRGQKDASRTPSMETFLTDEAQARVDAAARIAAGYADDVDPEEAAREAFLAQF